MPPSTDPVPPSTNQCRTILTQYHHGSTITALYWSSATKYQQVAPHRDPVPPCINQYRLLLNQYHQVPNSNTFCWTSTIIYQPVPLHNDPVPPSINQYQPILPTTTSTKMTATDFLHVYLLRSLQMSQNDPELNQKHHSWTLYKSTLNHDYRQESKSLVFWLYQLSAICWFPGRADVAPVSTYCLRASMLLIFGCL